MRMAETAPPQEHNILWRPLHNHTPGEPPRVPHSRGSRERAAGPLLITGNRTETETNQ